LAIKWLEKAKDQGLLEAKSMLGRLLVGREDSSEAGYQYLTEAAADGDEKAAETLRVVDEYRRKEGVQRQ
jgi:TPR repeat protein